MQHNLMHQQYRARKNGSLMVKHCPLEVTMSISLGEQWHNIVDVEKVASGMLAVCVLEDEQQKTMLDGAEIALFLLSLKQQVDP
eukprot:12486313-Ditylum_brightwellii.AAC.1